MKDHKLTTVFLDIDYSTLGELKEAIDQQTKEYGANAKINIGYEWSDLTYWRPLTTEEKEKAIKRQEAAKRGAKTRKDKREKAERAQYEKLRKKYGDS